MSGDLNERILKSDGREWGIRLEILGGSIGQDIMGRIRPIGSFRAFGNLMMSLSSFAELESSEISSR